MEEIWDYPTDKTIFGMRMNIKNNQEKSQRGFFFG
jgi:hypothetical protein